MKISTIIWGKVKVSYGNKMTWENENCTIDFKGDMSTAYIRKFAKGWESGDSLLIGIKKITEITSSTLKATGTIALGSRLIKATLEAEF